MSNFCFALWYIWEMRRITVWHIRTRGSVPTGTAWCIKSEKTSAVQVREKNIFLKVRVKFRIRRKRSSREQHSRWTFFLLTIWLNTSCTGQTDAKLSYARNNLCGLLWHKHQLELVSDFSIDSRCSWKFPASLCWKAITEEFKRMK